MVGHAWPRSAAVALALTGVLGACASLGGLAGSEGDAGKSEPKVDAVAPPEEAAVVIVDASDAHAPPRSDATDALVGQVPARRGGETPSTSVMNFAVHNLWLGDTDPDTMFNANSGAWATFGYNIDGKVTTAMSKDVCARAMDASAPIQIDGVNGADNSFGRNLISQLGDAFPGGASRSVSERITAGAFTVLLDTAGLTTSPTQTNTGLTGALYAGALFSEGDAQPTFTLKDNWPVDPSSIANGSLSQPLNNFSNAYVTHGTWVSGDPSDFFFTLAIDDQPFPLIFHQAVVTFQHTTDDAGQSHATGGVISGILLAGQFSSAIDEVLGGIANGLYCNLASQVVAAVYQSQDILLDGTNSEGVPCSAISIAVAFSADQIEPPSVVATAATVDGGPTPCGDAH